MLYEISGICPDCKTKYKIIIFNEETHGTCPDCGRAPVKVKKFKGMIYVIKNPNQVGVKVGLTKDINKRLKQLSGTGVPGKFNLIAIFPSEKPKDDEEKAHDKLKKYRLDKEHFDIDAIEAVQIIHRALNRRIPIFCDKDTEQQFEKAREENRKAMNAKMGKAES